MEKKSKIEEYFKICYCEDGITIYETKLDRHHKFLYDSKYGTMEYIRLSDDEFYRLTTGRKLIRKITKRKILDTPRNGLTASTMEALIEDFEEEFPDKADNYKVKETASKTEALLEDIEKRRKAEIK